MYFYRFHDVYLTEILRPANGCQKRKRGKGKKRVANNNGSQNVDMVEAQNVDVNMEETEDIDVNMAETEDIDVHMEETENTDVNMEEKQNAKIILPRGPWLSGLNRKQKGSLLYSLGYLTFEHGTKAQELRNIVWRMGGEDARKHLSNLAKSKSRRARNSRSS